MNKVTVVIPNWNGMRFLKDCMDSLEKQNFRAFDTLVIDNASTDGSVAFLREHYPWARVEVMEKNLGFSGGVNAGITLCETPYVLLLNNDTESDPNFVGEMVKAMDADSRIFSVSSKMVNFQDRSRLDDAGDLYNILGWGFQRGIDHPVDEKKYNRKKTVFSACAGAAIYRKSVFDEIGMFDLAHFAYLEDIDVGYRGRIYGYKNIYCPTAVVYHVGSGTSGSKYNDFKVKLSSRNNIYLNYKNMPLFFRIINFIPLWIGRKVKQGFFRKIGFEKAYLEGIKEGKEKKKTLKRVRFSWKHLGNYFIIEAALIKNFFVYCCEYISR